jgi:hypothetical protein
LRPRLPVGAVALWGNQRDKKAEHSSVLDATTKTVDSSNRADTQKLEGTIMSGYGEPEWANNQQTSTTTTTQDANFGGNITAPTPST